MAQQPFYNFLPDNSIGEGGFDPFDVDQYGNQDLLDLGLNTSFNPYDTDTFRDVNGVDVFNLDSAPAVNLLNPEPEPKPDSELDEPEVAGDNDDNDESRKKKPKRRTKKIKKRLVMAPLTTEDDNVESIARLAHIQNCRTLLQATIGSEVAAGFVPFLIVNYVARFNVGSQFRSVHVRIDDNVINDEGRIPADVTKVVVFGMFHDPITWLFEHATVERDPITQTFRLTSTPDQMSLLVDHMINNDTYHKFITHAIFMLCMAQMPGRTGPIYRQHFRLFATTCYTSAVASLNLEVERFQLMTFFNETWEGWRDIPITLDNAHSNLAYVLLAARHIFLATEPQEPHPYNSFLQFVSDRNIETLDMNIVVRNHFEQVRQFQFRHLEDEARSIIKEERDLWSVVYSFGQTLGADHPIRNGIEQSSGKNRPTLEKALLAFKGLTQLDVKTRTATDSVVPGEYTSYRTGRDKAQRMIQLRPDPFRLTTTDERHTFLQEYLRFLWFFVLQRAPRTASSPPVIIESWESIWQLSSSSLFQQLHALVGIQSVRGELMPVNVVYDAIAVLVTIMQRGLTFKLYRPHESKGTDLQWKNSEQDPNITDRIPNYDLFRRIVNEFLLPEGKMNSYPGFVHFRTNEADPTELDRIATENTALGDKAKPAISLVITRQEITDLSHYSALSTPYPVVFGSRYAPNPRKGFVYGMRDIATAFSGFGKPSVERVPDVDMKTHECYDIPSNSADIYTFITSGKLELILKSANGQLPSFPMLSLGAQTRWTEFEFVVYAYFLFEKENNDLGREFVHMGSGCTADFVVVLREILYDGHFNETRLLDMYVRDLQARTPEEAENRFHTTLLQLIVFVLVFGNQRYANSFNMSILPEIIAFVIRWSSNHPSDLFDEKSLLMRLKMLLVTPHFLGARTIDVQTTLAVINDALQNDVENILQLKQLQPTAEATNNLIETLHMWLKPLFFIKDDQGEKSANPILLGLNNNTNSTPPLSSFHIKWVDLLAEAAADSNFGLLQNECICLSLCERQLGIYASDQRHLNVHYSSGVAERLTKCEWIGFPGAAEMVLPSVPARLQAPFIQEGAEDYFGMDVDIPLADSEINQVIMNDVDVQRIYDTILFYGLYAPDKGQDYAISLIHDTTQKLVTPEQLQSITNRVRNDVETHQVQGGKTNGVLTFFNV